MNDLSIVNKRILQFSSIFSLKFDVSVQFIGVESASNPVFKFHIERSAREHHLGVPASETRAA